MDTHDVRGNRRNSLVCWNEDLSDILRSSNVVVYIFSDQTKTNLYDNG